MACCAEARQGVRVSRSGWRRLEEKAREVERPGSREALGAIPRT